LFNCFINGLIEKLEAVPGDIRISGIKINSIFFADDGTLVGRYHSTLQQLLNVCESWSKETGMKFAEKKCKVLNNTNLIRSLKLNGSDLDFTQDFKYLGCPMNINGINTTKLGQDSIKLVKFYTTWLLKRNFQQYGLKFKSIIFNCFITSRIEYCLNLAIFPDEIIKRLDTVRRWSLKKLLGVSRTTSNLATYLVTKTLPLNIRIKEIVGRFMFSLENLGNIDQSIPIYRIFKNEKLKNEVHRLPFFKYGLKNQLYQNLIRRNENTSIKNCILKFKCQELQPLIMENVENIAGTISKAYLGYSAKCISRPSILNTKLSIAKQKTLLKWMLGNYTFHQQCSKCGFPLDRLHAGVCSGINDDLTFTVPNTPTHLNKIDRMICYYDPKLHGRNGIKNIIDAILKVTQTCMVREIHAPPFGYGETHAANT
jgi:hypothetical protein